MGLHFSLFYFTPLHFASLHFKFTNRKEESKFAPKRTKKKEGKKGIYVHTYISSHIHSFLHKKRVNLFIKDIIMLVI